MVVSTFLGSIKDSVIAFSDEISNRVDADVLIVDNNFNVIGETKRYFNQYTEIGIDSIIGQIIIKQEKIIIADKQDYQICRKCKEIDNCQIVGFIGVPIYYENRVIGAIALILPKHRIASIFQDIDYSTAFIENMAEVLVGKIKNNIENNELKQCMKEREVLLDGLSDAVVLTDDFGRIRYYNRKFKSVMHIEQDCIGKQIQNILSHKLIEEFFEIRYPFKNQKIVLDFGNFSFYGFASCNIVRMKGIQTEAMFVFRSVNELLQDASVAGKGSLVTLQWLKEWHFPIDILDEAKTLAVTNHIILIHGKNQSLNEILAKGICNYSNRNLRGLITVYCDNIYRNLFEPFIFDEFGELQKADGGTLLFQNIEYLPLYLQSKLTEFLKNGALRSRNTPHIKSDVRLLFSSSKDLLKLVEKGLFLEELYYRIAEYVIEIPSLSKNDKVLQDIIDSGIEFYKKKYRKDDFNLSEAAIKLLSSYNWNEDVNELEKILEQIVIRNKGNVTDKDIHDMGLLVNEAESVLSISDLEKEKITELIDNGFNKTQISQMLGISRATLYRKIAEYRIS